MYNSPPLFLLLSILLGIFGFLIFLTGDRANSPSISRSIAISLTLPAMVMLGLFYTLAIHMRQSLGGWPVAIGTHGLPTPLITHGYIAGQFFSILLFSSFFVWPIACVLSATNRRWRGALPYLGIFALSCFVCFAAMLVAPSEFLIWWWD